MSEGYKKERRRADEFDILIEAILIAMITLPPLALGGVAPWARFSLAFLGLLLMVCWLAQGAWRGSVSVIRSPAWGFLLLFLGTALFQLTPFSPDVLNSISPSTWRVYCQAITDYPASEQARTLSLFPYATGMEIVRVATLMAVFFVVANFTRTRRQTVGIVLALAAVGSFEALYGFAEQFSGHKHIFWVLRQYHLEAVTGTFHNKNHFAGLLEMVIPVLLGLLVGIGGRPEKRMRTRFRGIPFRQRIVLALSSSTVYQQVIIAAFSVVMLAAVFFSLSRAGGICLFISLIGFVLFLAAGSGFRRYTLAVLLIVGAMFLVAAGIGMEVAISRIEDAVNGQSTSWIDRADLARSALTLIRDYPLFGTGLGSFGTVFPAYQSPRFGDAWADYLHNDWLQVFCETGIAGGVVLAIGSFWLAASSFRSAMRTEDPFKRWVALGASLGASAMLLHSFVDYNLSKITSNGIIFATVAGLALAVPRIPRRGEDSSSIAGRWILPLGPRPIRVATAVFVLALAAFASRPLLRNAVADVYFNQYLALAFPEEGPDDYFFLMSSGETGKPGNGETGNGLLRESKVQNPKLNGALSLPSSPAERSRVFLRNAVDLDPRNPRYLYYSADNALRRADEIATQEAAKRAPLLASAEGQEDTSQMEKVVFALVKSLTPQLHDQRRPLLLQAENFLRRAIDGAPTVARYHLALGRVFGELNQTSEQAAHRAEVGVAFAPNKPAILFDAGQLMLAGNVGRRHGLEEDPVDMARKYFRAALRSDPDYADRVYSFVANGGTSTFANEIGPPKRAFAGSDIDLLSVTPKTQGAYERLCSILWDMGDWEGVIACLEVIEELADAQRLGPQPTGFPAWRPHFFRSVVFADYEAAPSLKGARGYDNRAPLQIKLSVARRRCAVFGILGDWQAREEAASEHQALLRQRLVDEIAEARRLRGRGRNREAMREYLSVLRQDWANSEALFGAAELSSAAGAFDDAPQWNASIDHLYRLVINNSRLSADEYDRARRILNTVALRTDSDKLTADFIRGAGAILGGREEEGTAILGALAARHDETVRLWRQKHLIWHYLGMGFEKMGRKDDAIDAYGKAVEILPAHASSLVRLCELAGSQSKAWSARLAALTPEVPCNVDFGGKITLVGYTLSSERVPVFVEGMELAEEARFITYYWRFSDRLPPDYHPSVQFCDEDWQIVFRHDHRIYSEGRAYPTDFPRCGEVVAVRIRIKGDLTSAQFLKVGIVAGSARKQTDKALCCDAGNEYATLMLRQVQDTVETNESHTRIKS
ncbi:O-antigen ligase family protein [Candidatus Poribacteria bacterium]|nr:O-antigen ligase family protein [Candidatus Poribacteria bacterium]